MLIGVLYPIIQVQVCKYVGPYLVITLHEDILIPTDSWPLTGSILTDMSEKKLIVGGTIHVVWAMLPSDL